MEQTLEETKSKIGSCISRSNKSILRESRNLMIKTDGCGCSIVLFKDIPLQAPSTEDEISSIRARKRQELLDSLPSDQNITWVGVVEKICSLLVGKINQVIHSPMENTMIIASTTKEKLTKHARFKNSA